LAEIPPVGVMSILSQRANSAILQLKLTDRFLKLQLYGWWRAWVSAIGNMASPRGFERVYINYWLIIKNKNIITN